MTMKSEPFGRAICEALGLPADIIRSVAVQATANDVLRVFVELLPTLSEETLQRVKTLLAADNDKVHVTLRMVTEPLVSAMATSDEERGA